MCLHYYHISRWEGAGGDGGSGGGGGGEGVWEKVGVGEEDGGRDVCRRDCLCIKSFSAFVARSLSRSLSLSLPLSLFPSQARLPL